MVEVVPIRKGMLSAEKLGGRGRTAFIGFTYRRRIKLILQMRKLRKHRSSNFYSLAL